MTDGHSVEAQRYFDLLGQRDMLGQRKRHVEKELTELWDLLTHAGIDVGDKP